MTTDTAPVQTRRGGRVAGALLAAWGAVTGVAPHVLHHVGPLAGAAFVAGATGQVLFGALALVVSVPFLLRLHKRFNTWAAPAIAVGLMAAMFALSTFVIGPAITGEDDPPAPADVEQTQNPEHDEHGH